MKKYLIFAVISVSMLAAACSTAAKSDEEASKKADIIQTADIIKPAIVNFDFDSININSQYYPILKLFLEQINQEGIIINIDGYTDDIGSELYNDKLSMQRAEAVADYLANYGINRDILVTRGHGKSGFIADNETEEGRAQNRRVEISITK